MMHRTVIELFAGVGGFHLGLSRSGWKIIWANQWEPGKKEQWAFKCYTRHFNKNETVCMNEDISMVPTEDIPPARLLVGGFPCQDYSVATSNAHGIEGKKGVLWWHIERILRDNLERNTPIPYVILENVDRLIKSPSNQRGRDFGIILSCLNNLGYIAEWRVINAADYGYPQKRRRTFIFATLVKEIEERYYNGRTDPEIVMNGGFFGPEFPCIKHKNDTGASICLKPDLVRMTKSFEFNFQNAGYMKDGRVYTIKVNASYQPSEKHPKRTLGSILQECVDDSYIIPTKWIGDEADRGTVEYRNTWRYCKGAKDEARMHKNGHQYRYNEGGIPFPDRLDEPSRTMLTSEGNRRPNRIGHIIPVDPKNNLYRILTPVEAERLNGFDDGWTEEMPERWRYFCMGNALVVGLIEQIGSRLNKIDDTISENHDNRIHIRINRGAIIGPLDLCKI